MKKKKRLMVDMDGTLAVFTPTETLEDLYAPGYFRNLKPIQSVLETIRKIIREVNDEIEVFVLSAYLTDNPLALYEKNAWLDEFLPELDHEHRIFCPCGSDKSLFVPNGISKDDFLLDDYTHNLNEWQKKGTAIKLLNGINATKGTWDGPRIDYTKSPDELVSALSSIVLDRAFVQDTIPREHKPSNTIWHYNGAVAKQASENALSKAISIASMRFNCHPECGYNTAQVEIAYNDSEPNKGVVICYKADGSDSHLNITCAIEPYLAKALLKSEKALKRFMAMNFKDDFCYHHNIVLDTKNNSNKNFPDAVFVVRSAGETGVLVGGEEKEFKHSSDAIQYYTEHYLNNKNAEHCTVPDLCARLTTGEEVTLWSACHPDYGILQHCGDNVRNHPAILTAVRRITSVVTKDEDFLQNIKINQLTADYSTAKGHEEDEINVCMDATLYQLPITLIYKQSKYHNIDPVFIANPVGTDFSFMLPLSEENKKQLMQQMDQHIYYTNWSFSIRNAESIEELAEISISKRPDLLPSKSHHEAIIEQINLRHDELTAEMNREI